MLACEVAEASSVWLVAAFHAHDIMPEPEFSTHKHA